MPLPTTRRNTLSTALATLLAALVLLTLLGHARLTDWDEAIYAGIAREMLHTGLLTPHWNAQPWLEKPPLALWLTAIAFRLFGVTEFTARLTSALSGIALVALLHAWLTLRRNELTAWLNTLILLSTFGFLHVARVGEMDVLLSLTCTLALIGLCELDRGNSTGWLLFWLGFALALITKGAASVTLPITLVLYLAAKKFTSTSATKQTLPALRRSSSTFFLSIILFLALTLPWHLALLHQFGEAFTQQYLGLHVLTRATSQIEGHTTPWYFYLRVLLVSAAPWVLLYPIAVYRALTRSGQPQPPAATTLRPFALYALAVLTLFTCAQTRLPHYIAPAYPALSLLAAAWLADHLRPSLSPGPSRRTVLLKLTAATVTLYVVATLVTSAPRKTLHTARLANGQTTPDNREQVALLKQVFQHPSPAVADMIGPLLTLRTGTYNPIPTTVFYSGRQVQQTTLTQPTPPTDKYTNDPIPLTAALADHHPHLLLTDRMLVGKLPGTILFQPLATSTRLTVGLATEP